MAFGDLDPQNKNDGPGTKSTLPSNNPSTNPTLFGIAQGYEGEPVQGLTPPSAGIGGPGLTGVAAVGIPGYGLTGQPTTIAQAVAAMMHFNRSDLIWLQDQLAKAGYFTSSS